MVCDCCGRKKKLFDMFYSVGGQGVHLCSDCYTVLERMQSDANGGEHELYELHLEQWKRRAKAPSPAFLAWQQTYLAQIEDALKWCN